MAEEEFALQHDGSRIADMSVDELNGLLDQNGEAVEPPICEQETQPTTDLDLGETFDSMDFLDVLGIMMAASEMEGPVGEAEQEQEEVETEETLDGDEWDGEEQEEEEAEDLEEDMEEEDDEPMPDNIPAADLCKLKAFAPPAAKILAYVAPRTVPTPKPFVQALQNQGANAKTRAPTAVVQKPAPSKSSPPAKPSAKIIVPAPAPVAKAVAKQACLAKVQPVPKTAAPSQKQPQQIAPYVAPMVEAPQPALTYPAAPDLATALMGFLVQWQKQQHQPLESVEIFAGRAMLPAPPTTPPSRPCRELSLSPEVRLPA